MKRTRFVQPVMLACSVGGLCLAAVLYAAPPAGRTSSASGSVQTATDSQADGERRVTVEVARDRAKLMHNIYAATLEMMHDRYFHGERAFVPARAMQDVFSEIKQQSQVEARWISVNMKPMSIDHEPKSEFEKKAAKEIATGKSEVEELAGGYYRRAGAIPLTDGCISCHGGFFKEPSKTPRFAGLVISVPVNNQSDKH